MNLFYNISHPAHYHFFKNSMTVLKKRGHNIIIGARDKEFVLQLLEADNQKYNLLTKKGVGFFGLICELFKQQILINRIIKKNSIDLMLQIGGIFNAPIGKLRNIPTFAFSDTENDIWGNKLSFRLSSYVFMPTSFDHNYGGYFKNEIHYPGYHELAYLSPNLIEPIKRPENKYLLRFVGWGAGHDIGETSLSEVQKIELVNVLLNYGKVYISSESKLPDKIEKHAINFHPSKIHEFMKSCKLIIGESATMTSEAACMGIPSVFISNTGRGYTTEQDEKFGLVKYFKINQWDEIKTTLIDWASKDLFNEWQEKRIKMLNSKIDVNTWLVDLIENHDNIIREAKNNKFNKYYLNKHGWK